MNTTVPILIPTIIIAALAIPSTSYSGGIAPEQRRLIHAATTTALPPANPCQHIPWTECGSNPNDSDSDNDTTIVTVPTQPVPTHPPVPQPPAKPPKEPPHPPTPKPCLGGSKGGC